MKVNCPNCGVRLSASVGLEGKPVNCQKCNTKFVLSRRWAMEALEESAYAAQETDGSLEDERPRTDSDSGSTGKSIQLLIDDGEIDEPLLDGGGIDSFNLVPSAITKPTSPTTVPRRDRKPARIEILENYDETTSFWELFDFGFQRYLTPHIVRISWFLILLAVAVWLLIVSYFYLSSVINRQPFALPEIRDASVSPAMHNFPSSIGLPQFFYSSAIYLTTVLTCVVALIWIRVGLETIIMIFKIGGELRNRK